MSPEPKRPHEAAEIEKWIVGARQGDREALGQLLEMCRNFLLSTANKKLVPALRAKLAPSDIVQECLMEAGRHFQRFHGSNWAALLAWLHGILHNIIADTYRHYTTEKRLVAREVSLAEVPQIEMLFDSAQLPSQYAQAQEQREKLEIASQRLPEHYRRVLRMYTRDGLTFVQIAVEMGSTAEAVRKLWRRAIEELTKHLNPLHESI